MNDKRSERRSGGTGYLRCDSRRTSDRGADADIAKMLRELEVRGPNGEVCDAGADEVVRWALKIRKVGRKWVVYRYDPDGWLQHKVGWFESREDAQRCIDNHRERR